MRVLHFAGSYFPVPGGTTTRICNMLADPQNQHLLVVPYPQHSQYSTGSPLTDEEQGHIRICRVRLPVLARCAESVPFFGNCLRARQFVRSVGTETFDILHGHNPRACAMAALRFKRKTGLPMVYEAHGIMQDQCNLPKALDVFEPFKCASTWLARRAGARLESSVVQIADRIIVQTENARKRLIRLYGIESKPIDIIPNGVDVERFDSSAWQEQRHSLRQQFDCQGRIVCLYAGYLDEVNGISFLLKAVDQLSVEMRQRLKFVLLGRGPLRDEVQKAAQERPGLIDFAGVVEYGQMPTYYAASDVFIIPRLPTPQAETLLPIKLLEAMAMEKILLVSNVSAMADVVTDGVNGFVFEKADLEDFLSKIEGIATGNEHLQELGRRARQDVREKYSWEQSRNKLQFIYEQLLR